MAQAGGMPQLSPELFRALALNPLTAPLAQKLIEQQIEPRLVDMGTDPFTGQKTYAQQIGNRLVPLNVQGGTGGETIGGAELFNKLDQMTAAGATMEQKLAVIPAGVRDDVRSVIQGTKLPANLGKSNLRGMILRLATQVDRSFDETKIPVRMQMQRDFAGEGKNGQAIQFLRTMQGHTEAASDALERMAAAGMGNWPSINAAKAYVSQHTGQDQELRLALKAYDDAINAAKHEMGSTYAGSGHVSDADRATWDKLSSVGQIDQLRQELYDYTHLIGAKREAMNETYQTEFHRDAPLIVKERVLGDRVLNKVTSRLPNAAPEKQEWLRAQAEARSQTSAIPSEWTIREH
jgi:hypothetical protein